MLRESIEFAGDSINLDGLADTACTRIEGIPHSEALLIFTNAFMGDDADALADAREKLAHEMNPEALVDAAGVASNFQRMVRIADSTGIPADDIMAVLQEDLVEKMGLNKFTSATNTKPMSWVNRLKVKLLLVPRFRRGLKDKSS